MKMILGSLLALGLMASAASAQCSPYGHGHRPAKIAEKPVDVTPAPAPVEPAPAPVPQK